MASLESQLKAYASGSKGGSGDLNYRLNALAKKAGYNDDYFAKEDEKRKQSRQKRIDEGLNKGMSWEDISKQTGISLDEVRGYSQSTRPTYGTDTRSNLKKVGEGLLDFGGAIESVIQDVTGGTKRKEETFERKQDIINARKRQIVESGVLSTETKKRLLDDIKTTQRAAYDRATARRSRELGELEKTLESPVLRGGASFGAGVKRSGEGLVQGVGGLYDLITPGEGRNRVTQAATRSAEASDRLVKENQLNEVAYKGGQLTGEALQLLTGARAVKAMSKLPQVSKLAAVAGKADELEKVLMQVNKGGKVGEAAIKTARYLIDPSRVANIMQNVAVDQGQIAARDQDISGKTVAQSVGLNYALGGVLDAVPSLSKSVRGKAGGVFEGTKSITTNLADSKLGKSIAASKVGKKLTHYKDETVRSMVSDINYVNKMFGDAVEAGDGGWKIKDRVSHLRTNIKQAAAQADASLDDNAGWSALVDSFEGMSNREGRRVKQELGNFISEKQDAINHNKLVETGRIKGKVKEIPVGTEAQESAYRALNDSTKPVIQKMYDSGRISEAKYKEWMADTDYTRVQREIDDELMATGGTGPRLEPSAKGVVGQKLKGSSKKQVDPFSAFIDWNRRVHIDLEKNALTKYIRDQALEKGITKPLRVADKVLKRYELYGEAAQLRPFRDQLGKILKTQNKYVKQIQRDMAALKKEAYSEVESKLTKAVDGKVVPEGGPTVQNVAGVIDEIMSTDMATLNRLNKKYMNRDKKLSQALDEMIAIKKQHDAVKSDVNELLNKARSADLRDLDPNGEQTMSVWENGIRELYTIDPRAAKQIKGMTEIELGAVGKLSMAASNLLRGGATAWNTAFAVPNFIKDQLSSAVMSKSILSTHNPIVFAKALKETALKPLLRGIDDRLPTRSEAITRLLEPSPAYKEWASKNKYITRADLHRQLKKAVRESEEALGVRGEGLFRKYEGIISAGEETTRFQNFLGELKRASKKDGMSIENATALAHEASRNNSINFSNQGEMTTFLRVFNPYFNAAVQGSATLARAFNDRPIGTGIKIATTTMLPVALATYHNFSDPKRAQRYLDGTSERERDNNIIFVTDSGAIVKVPLPSGINSFAKPLRNYIESEYVGDRQGFLETAKNLLVDPFSPVGTTKNELLAQALPQPIKPLVETAINKDLYTGREVVPERMAGLPKGEQAFESTPEIYKSIGKILNVSPLQVRKLVTGYGAGGAEGALTTGGAIAGQNTGKRSTLEQIAGRFYKSPDEGSGQVESKFYQTYTPLKQRKEAISSKITTAVQNKDYAKANELTRQINNQIEEEKKTLRQTYGRYETDLSGLYSRLDYLKIPTDKSGLLSKASIKARSKTR